MKFQNPIKIGDKTDDFSTVTPANAAFNDTASSSDGHISTASEIMNFEQNEVSVTYHVTDRISTKQHQVHWSAKKNSTSGLYW